MKKQIPNIAGALALIFFAAFPFVYSGANYDYVMHILITAFFYAILASSWSMLAGYAGQFSFGHMGFMGSAPIRRRSSVTISTSPPNPPVSAASSPSSATGSSS